MICNLLSYSNYSWKAEQSFYSAQTGTNSAFASKYSVYFTNKSPKPLNFTNRKTWKQQQRDKTEGMNALLSTPAQNKQAVHIYLRQLRSAAHRGDGSKGRKAASTGCTGGCAAISYQPDPALRTTCSTSPPGHRGSASLHGSLAAPLDLKTRNNTDTGLHCLQGGHSWSMYNTASC